MSFFPHLTGAGLRARDLPTGEPGPWPMVDTLYDYAAFLSDGAPIATVAPPLWGTRVAIVGAGAAGIVAAYELFRAGLNPVVFEATDRIGGRNHSHRFGRAPATSAALAELGAMRVPASCAVFFHYARLLDLTFTSFPDPGSVPTTLHYRGVNYRWNPGDDAPGPFAAIARAFGAFSNQLTEPVWTPWKAGDREGVRMAWQALIDRYADVSFLTALAQGIPEWSPADLDAFGALGMGSGGFGPVYGIGFLEILRILVNRWEIDQKLPQLGIGGLTSQLYHRKVKRPDGTTASLADIQSVRLNSPVTGLDSVGGKVVVRFSPPGGPAVETFPATVVATTSHAMAFMGLTVSPEAGEPAEPPVLSAGVKSALRNLPLMTSSKLFIRTRDKFWRRATDGMPQTIQTDELPRGIYCLDYPQTDEGVVLISYTWGDDSNRLLARSPRDRFGVFKDIIGRIDQTFASHLVPMDDEIVAIDWQSSDHYFGAFRLNQPGDEPHLHQAYYQFLDVLTPAADRGVYLAGDSVSWAGGWTEGALQTGLNAACAAAKRIGAALPAHSPLSQQKTLYHYDGGRMAVRPGAAAQTASGTR